MIVDYSYGLPNCLAGAPCALCVIDAPHCVPVLVHAPFPTASLSASVGQRGVVVLFAALLCALGLRAKCGHVYTSALLW